MNQLGDRVEQLTGASRKLGSVADIDELHRTTFELLRQIFHNQTAAFFLLDQQETTLIVAATSGYDESIDHRFKIKLGEGVIGQVAETGNPMLVPDAQADSRCVLGDPRAMSKMSVPLQSGNDMIGVLDVESVDTPFTNGDLALFSLVAGHVAMAMRNVQLQDSLAKRARKIAAIAKAGQSLTHSRDLDQLLTQILESVHQALRLDVCAILLWDEAQENLVVTAALGYDREVKGIKIKRGEGVTGLAAEENRPIVVGDVSSVDYYVPGLSDCLSDMAIPLVFHDQVIGVLNAEDRRVNCFDDTDLLHATVFADQAAGAIGNARIHAELCQSMDESSELKAKLNLIAATSAEIMSLTDLDALLDKVLSMVRDALDIDNIAVLLPEPSGLHLRVHRASTAAEVHLGLLVPIEKSITGRAYLSGDSIFVSDVRRESTYVPGCPDCRSEIAVPLKVEDDVVGVLNTESREERALTENDLLMLEMVAAQVSVAVRNARQRADLSERNRRLTLIHQASCSVNKHSDPDEMLGEILESARRALDLDAVSILIPDPDGRHLKVRRALSRGNVEGLNIPIENSFVGKVYTTNKSAIIDDIEHHEGYLAGTPGARCEMAVPLSLEGEIIGILDAEAFTPFAFSKSDLHMFRIFSSQVVTAFKKTNLIASLEERTRKLTLIHRAACSLNADADPEEMLETILALARQALDLQSVAILTPDPTGKRLTVRKALDHGDTEGLQIPVESSFVGRVFTEGRADILGDISEHNTYIPGMPGARCEMAAPLSLKGAIIGVLDTETTEPHAFSKDDLDLFRLFSSQAATALRSVQLVNDLKTRSKRLSLLNQAACALNTVHDTDELIDEMLRLVNQALNLDRCALLLVDPETMELVVNTAVGYGDIEGFRLPLGKGVTGTVALSGEPMLVQDTVNEDSYINGQAEGRCEMAAPLRVHGETVGVLDTESPTAGAFDSADLELFNAFAAQAAVALHNSRLIKRLENANRDLSASLSEMSRLNVELENYSDEIAQANGDLARQLKKLTTVHEAGKTITSSLDLDSTLEAILSMTGKIIGSTTGAIKLLDDETKELKVRARSGELSDISGAFSIFDMPLKIGDKTIGVFEFVRKASEAVDAEERQMLETMASQAAIAIENARLFENTQRVYYETLRSLAKALEARDDYTRGHSERVAALSRDIANKLELDDRIVHTIYNAALLHDIGKIGIRDEVLLAPRQLTVNELEIIREHPTFGNTILMPLKFLGEIREFVRYHHERWDGSGYPDGRQKEQIPLASRIISVADAFDAMTSNRPYRKALSRETALVEIERSAGRQFDPQVVQAFLSVVRV